MSFKFYPPWGFYQIEGQVKPAETHLWISANRVSVFGLVVFIYLFTAVVVIVCAHVVDDGRFSGKLKKFILQGPLLIWAFSVGLGKFLVIWSHGHTLS